MANLNAPIGLLPTRHKSGAPYNGSANKYYVPATDTDAMYIGDPVIIAGSGDVNGVPSVALAAAGDRITGVIVGFDAVTGATTETGLTRGYRNASEEDYLLVCDDPDVIFEVQEDSVGGALAAADIGLNADLIAAVGSAYSKRSGYQLDTSTKATTAAQVRIQGFSTREGNEIGDNAKVLVSIVESTQTPAAGTTGV